MFARRSLMVFALALSVARCADQPTAVQAAAGPQLLRWADAPQFTAGADVHADRSGTIAQTPPLSLNTYAVSFWAVRGQSRSVQINYKSTFSTTHPFMTLTVTDPKYAPGLGNFGMRDSVLITVTVDTSDIGVSLAPSGLIFGDPAQLKIWYDGAGGDFNGDGVVDSTDAAIEARLLGLWYRADLGKPWSKVGATQSLAEKSFTYAMPHFCDYAVAAAGLLEWAVAY
jgi:hypothetical protein